MGELATPKTISHFRLLEHLGAGGMGTVYKAHDTRLDRLVAVKRISPETQDPHATDRLMLEARAAAALNHPNIAVIYEVDQEEDEAFIAMEFVEGQTLYNRVRAETVDWEIGLQWLIESADALIEAHAKGVIHRDIKTKNLMVTQRGSIKILDFGLAKVAGFTQESSQMTQSGSLVGTIDYLAPEILRGGEASNQSDLFSLGVVAYEIFAGKLPFRGRTPVMVMMAILEETPKPLSDLAPELPATVVDIVHQCLRKDPTERFASAQDLRNALLAYKASFDTSVTTTVTPESETPNNLPLELTSFVGRETELDRLARLLEENRLVTITGTGGGGKTRLGLELAGRHLQDYRDGVYLIELAAVTEGDQLAETMARTMNVRQETGTSIESTLVRSLGSKSMLLIIDNCEHILENVAPLITKLLKSCPNLKVLATSRERLDVPGETAWPIPSLRVPAPEDVLSVATAASNEAVRLFAERASSASTGFSLTDSNLEDVVQICHRLDGIPLAIELAAARVRLLDLKEILKRLEDRFRLLRGGSRTSLPRQQTLKATVAWSVDLLTEEERILFSRLSIFSGGFTLGSAEAILSDDVVDEFDILDHLSRLADKSLVSVTDSGARYHLLEMLREYGAEELQDRGETETFLKRHAEYFLALAEEAEPELTGAHQGAWLERLAREYPNIDQAGATLVSLGMAGESLRLGAALWRFLFVRGYLEEGRQLLESILAVETSGLEKAAQLARAKALRGLGTLANDQGDYPIAREHFLQCLDIYRSLDHHAGIAQVSNSLGIAARDQGEYEDARRLLADAMKAHQEAGNKAGESASIHGLGIVAHRVGDLEEARERFDAGLKIRRQLEDRRGIAALLAHLGSVELDLGNLEQAEALLNQGLDMFRELSNKRGILWALMQLGGVALAQGNIGESRRHHRESLFLSRSLGDKHHVARSLECFASLNLAEGKPDKATRLFGAADVLRSEIGSPITPFEKIQLDKDLEIAKEQNPGFTDSYAGGLELNWVDAAQEALEA